MTLRRRDVTPVKKTPVSSKRSVTLVSKSIDSLEWSEAVSLADLHPTQVAVGMRAVEAKRRKIERRADTRRKLRRYLEQRPVPAVLGPGEEFYIIDHHHLSLALWQSEVDEVFVRVIGDLSDIPKRRFMRSMEMLGWLHPYDEAGRRICPTRLPTTIDKLRSDCYRDLAWQVREAGGFQKTQIPFCEFAWANFFRSNIPLAMVRRDFDFAYERAMRLARTPDAKGLPGHIGAAF